jgi:hypothetical protein
MSAAPVVAIFCGSCKWTDRERIRGDLGFLLLYPSPSSH